MAHYARRPIVSDGLVFQIDAANKVGQFKNIINPTQVGSPINGASIVNDTFDFDGIDDRLQYASTINDFGDEDCYFQVWINPDQLASKRTIMAKGSVSGVNRQYYLETQIGGSFDRVTFQVSDGGAYVPVTSDALGSKLEIGKWSLITCFHDSVNDLIGVAIDDDPFQTVAHSTGINNAGTAPFEFGGRSTAGEWHNYQVATCYVYNKILSTQEREQNYNAMKHRFN
jgi:hypothetical protein